MLGTPPVEQHAPQFVAHARARGGIERRKRLVQQQQRRLRRQRARQRHTLLLAAGERARQAVGQFGQAEGLQQLAGRLAAARRSHVVPPPSGAGTARSPETGIRRAVVAAAGEMPRAESYHVRAAERDGARVGPVQAGQQAQQRGLARAGRAEQHRDRRLVERDAQVGIQLEADAPAASGSGRSAHRPYRPDPPLQRVGERQHGEREAQQERARSRAAAA